ncbi:MAG: hypothetical protein HYT87_02270 [Nitrospirae bacterium]|nr:hypothetical protein [Nitrospirota bacterium]
MIKFRNRLTDLRAHGLTSPASRGLRPHGLRLSWLYSPLATRHSPLSWGKLGFGACVGIIMLMSIGYRPKLSISVPSLVVPFASPAVMNKDALLFDLRRPAFDILEQLMGPGLNNTEMRDFLEKGMMAGPCPGGAPASGVSGLLMQGADQCPLLPGEDNLDWICAWDSNNDGHVIYFDSAASLAPPDGINCNDCNGDTNCGDAASCPPKMTMTPYKDSHGAGHPNEPHIDAKITLYDMVMELRARMNVGALSICGTCENPMNVKFAVFPLTIVINPDKVDVNNVNARRDDPVITIDISNLTVDPQGSLFDPCFGLELQWSCVAGFVQAPLENALQSAIQKQFSGFLPMDMNGMFASEPAYACPTYSGTIKNPWCKWGVQNDPAKAGYGYCYDCEGGGSDPLSPCPGGSPKSPDGMVEVNSPAYNAQFGESAPPKYGTLACGDALINLGVYPHLRVENPSPAPADDRMTMIMDLGCEVQEAAPDIIKTRIDVQDKLCKPTHPCATGGTCDNSTCSPFPDCCAANTYPKCCSLTIPTNTDGFACSVGQDVGNQITSAIAQSGLVSCEVSKDGLKTGLPIPMPLDMAQFLKVESFANLIPPIDDQADPGSHVKIRWRPYGDGNVATKEVCAAIGGEPGAAYGCTALCKDASNPANAAYCSDPLNCCYPAGPVDINFSFRNIYTDFFIQVGGNPDTKAFGVSMDVGGALDMEFKTATEANRVFANKAAFLTSGCNPLAGGTVDCLKVAIDPLELMNVQFRYQELDPAYTLNYASLDSAFPDVLVNLMGGAAQAWVETQIQLAGLGFNMISAGPDTGGFPDLDGNGKADYLTCSGNFAGSFDLIKLLQLLTGGAGGGDNPCAVENLKAYARRMDRVSAASSRLSPLSSRLTPASGPETFIIHPFTGQPEATFQFVAEESRRASLIPEKPVRLQVYAVGSGVINYTWRLDRGVWRVTTEPVIQLPYLLEGTHLLEVQAVDQTGLADPTPAMFTFQVDTQPPRIGLFGLTAYANVTGPDEVPVYFVDSNMLRVDVSDFQTPFTHIKASYFLDGKEVKMTEPKMEIDPARLSRTLDHILSVRATDASGLESTREWRFTFRKESDPPDDENFFGCETLP